MKVLNISITQLVVGLLFFVNLINQTNAANTFNAQTLFAENADSFYVNTQSLNKSGHALLPQNGKIAFEEGSLTNSAAHEIYIMNNDGSNQVRLTNNNAYDGDPFFSPDGTKIVFSRGSGTANSHEIYIMNSDGSNQVRITNNSVADEYPKWSPDGGRIIFHSNRDGGDRDIFVMNVDGSNVIQLTANSNVDDAEASFSPDGTKILFFRAPLNSGNSEVYVMNSDGSNPVNVSNHPSSDGSCSWSPDGQKIAFVSGRNGNTEVYTMNADGSGQIRLTNNNLLDNTPVWGAAILEPTSSNASISGQILTYERYPVSKAQVRLIYSDGSFVTVTSGSFGYYQFNDVPTGQTYIIKVIDKEYSFATRVITLIEDMTELNFIADY